MLGNTRYYCDPKLNKKCKKTACFKNGGPCKCTTQIKYAKKPIEKILITVPMEEGIEYDKQ